MRQIRTDTPVYKRQRVHLKGPPLSPNPIFHNKFKQSDKAHHFSKATCAMYLMKKTIAIFKLKQLFLGTV